MQDIKNRGCILIVTCRSIFGHTLVKLYFGKIYYYVGLKKRQTALRMYLLETQHQRHQQSRGLKELKNQYT